MAQPSLVVWVAVFQVEPPFAIVPATGTIRQGETAVVDLKFTPPQASVPAATFVCTQPCSLDVRRENVHKSGQKRERV